MISIVSGIAATLSSADDVVAFNCARALAGMESDAVDELKMQLQGENAKATRLALFTMSLMGEQNRGAEKRSTPLKKCCKPTEILNIRVFLAVEHSMQFNQPITSTSTDFTSPGLLKSLCLSLENKI